MTNSMIELIEKKKRGNAHTLDELSYICHEYTRGNIPDYQLAAWLMAVVWRGMTPLETYQLTQGMVSTGRRLTWNQFSGPVLDKHSTGGVGDKTSLVLVPLVAATGVPFVKMSGRGLGHTGGTIDKLESIPGFQVTLSLKQLSDQVNRIGCALVSQLDDLVPADRAIYALRDVTATVDSAPLIASSIMSKKLAGGANILVLDVKYGSGSLLRSEAAARQLAQLMLDIAVREGVVAAAVISSMEEPLGRAVGNALEVQEAIDTLKGSGPEDLLELCLTLGAHQLRLAGVSKGIPEARRKLIQLIETGRAAEKFQQLVAAQGGNPAVIDNPDVLPRAPVIMPVHAPAGDRRWVMHVDARDIADAALMLGAGRRVKGQEIDPAVGVIVEKKQGDRVVGGESIAVVHASNEELAQQAATRVAEAFGWSDQPVMPLPSRHYVLFGGAGT